MRINMGYPTFNEEIEVLKRSDNPNIIDNLETVVSMEEINHVKNNYNQVVVNEDVKKMAPYILNHRLKIRGMNNGDYIGDISAKRYIIDDPIVTAGIREYTGFEPEKTIH